MISINNIINRGGSNNITSAIARVNTNGKIIPAAV
jgi:hypothetical protein